MGAPTLLNLLPVFLVGLAGGVHCIGMCGGIVGALSAAPAAQPAKPARQVIAIARVHSVADTQMLRLLAYNSGRVISYMAAGALAGGLAAGAMAGITTLQLAGYWLANLMLVALGLYLMDAWRGLVHLEALGQTLWRRLKPLVKPLLPMDSPAKALLLGALWGWVPCGMVYSVLFTAMLSGSSINGAAVMLAFGLGTLPTLLALGLLGARLRQLMQRRAARIASGVVVLAFGLIGVLRAAGGMAPGWLDALCLSPHP